MSSEQWLTRKLLELEQRTTAVSRSGVGIGRSSTAPGESLTMIGENSEIILQNGGIDYVSGPVPPVPSTPALKLGFGTIEVTWDGAFAEAADADDAQPDTTAPLDFDVIEVHCSTDPEEAHWGDDTLKGQIKSKVGGTTTVGGFDVDDTVFVCLIAVSKTEQRSEPSARASIIIEGLNFEALFNELDAANTRINNAREILLEEQQTLGEKLSAVDGTLDSLPADIAQARQDAIDAALAEIQAVEGSLTTALGLKNKTTWSTSNPPTQYSGAAEDTWIKLTSLGSGGREIGRWRWNGNVWVIHLVDGAVLSNVDASTITTGFLDVANRIRAGAILADKLLIGSGANLIPGADKMSTSAVGFPGMEVDPAENALRVKGKQTLYSAAEFKLPPGKYRMTVDLKSSAPTNTYIGIYHPTPRWIYAINNQPITTSWATYSGTLEVSEANQDYPFVLRLLPAYTGDIGGGYTWYRNLSLRPMAGGTLITPSGVQTPHLAADVLEVGNLKAGTAALAEAVIKKLFAEVVVARMALAEEFIGENAILTGAVTASKITASEELWAKIGEFVRIRTGMLEADAVDGMVITGATMQTATTGARVALDASGLSVFDDADDWRVRLTPYGSTFKGDLEAESLVATGPAEFRSTDNKLGQGARLVLEAGVTDPTAPPVVQPYWAADKFNAFTLQPAGLAFDGTYYWTTISSGWFTSPDGSRLLRVLRIDPATGDRTPFALPVPEGRHHGSVYGITCIGSELFVLYNSSYTAYVAVMSLDGSKLREWEYRDLGYSSGNPLTYNPGIGTDGTNVVIAQCDDTGQLNIRTYNKTTGALISRARDANDGTKSDITGIYIGPGDWGGGTYAVVAKASTKELVRFETNGVYSGVDKKWPTAEGAADTGVVFAGGKFRSLNQSGRVNQYEGLTMGDGASDWWGVYRWADDPNGDDTVEVRSRISPPKQFTWPRRSRLKFLGNPLPDGATMIMPSVAKKTTTPVRTDFRTPNWTPEIGISVAAYQNFPADWQSTVVPPDSNNFPQATPAALASASKSFEVRGDGSGQWGQFTFNPNGTVTNSADVGWTDLPNPGNPFTERANGQYMVRAGIVYFRGQYSFTGSGMQTVMTLPPAIRPGYLYQTAAISNTTVNLYWEIGADGVVKLWASGATGAWVNLTSISYPIG